MREDQYRALLRASPVNIGINLLAGGGLFAVFLSAETRLFLSLWLAATLIIALARLALVMRGGRREAEHDALGWRYRVLTLSSVASGLLWGLAGVVLLPDASTTQQVFLAVVASALVGGSATTLSAVPLAAVGFALGVTFPIAGHFISVGELAYAGLGALSAFFGLAMSLASRGAFERFRAQVRSRLENEALASKIAAERSQWLELSANAEAFALFDRDNRLTLWNPAFQRALSLPPGSLTLGAPFTDLLVAGVRPVELMERRRAIDNWIAALTPPSSGHRAPATYRMANGRWLRTSSHRTASGGTMLHMVDVTELKTQELALQSAQSELAALAQEKKEGFASLVRKHQELKDAMNEIASARDEAIRANAAQLQFLAKVSHEFRTPLNAIIGFSEFMAQGLGGPIGIPRYQTYVEDIVESGYALLKLVTQILDYARADSGEISLVRKPVDLEAIVASSCLQLAHAASQSDVPINVERKAPRWPRIEADEDRIKQILACFLSNAVKASTKGSAVRLRVAEAGDRLWLIVADRGTGMTMAEMNSALAKPVVKVSAPTSATSGLGLGLPMARALIELHGGTLVLKSRIGKGTVAVAKLPLKPQAEKPSTAARKTDQVRVLPLR